jgi:DNA repair protein RadA/Sms
VAQIAAALKGASLYVSGEESASQIKMRFDRLNLQTKNLKYLGETEAGMIAAAIEEIKPALAIVDSIQTIRSDEVPSEAGSVNQIKVSAAKIADAAKSNNIPVIIIGHITKEGRIAGPKTLEHIVDVVLNLEGDKLSQSRILRTPKNRFGSTDEVGIFKMTETGLREVKNPSELFLEGRSAKSGSVITCVMEGTRPILVEVQALLERTNFRFPQRRASGFDINRLQIIATTLAKRAGLYLFKYDIHLNIVGGLKIKEPSADLAVALAVASAYFNKIVDPKIVAFGEVGLGGEIRPAGNLEKQIKETEKMGFKYAITNPGNDFKQKGSVEILSAKNINEAIEIIR